MSILLIQLMNLAIAGFLTGWIGIILGICLSFLIKPGEKRLHGIILGFLGGIMFAVICFDLIPEAMENSNLFIGIISLLIGLAFAAWLDGFLSINIQRSMHFKKNRYIRVALFIAIGTAIHNISGGIAFGTLLSISIISGIQMAIALILHSIPEGLTLGMYLREGSCGSLFRHLLTILIAVPLGIGAAIGGLLSKTPFVISSSMTFASGLILYAICKEILPESNGLWRGRLTAVCTVLGIVVGITVTSAIH